MPAEPLALSTVPPAPTADTDYDAICAAVTATARGRWFLDEFAKRNRNSDTSQVLAAIARMEAAVVGERAQQASREANQEVRIELLEMARTIAQTRADVAESRPAPRSLPPSRPATPAPDVAAAAERLRQIAWTMRACGIELPPPTRSGRSRTRSCRPMRCAILATSAPTSSPRRCTISSIASTGCSTATRGRERRGGRRRAGSLQPAPVAPPIANADALGDQRSWR